METRSQRAELITRYLLGELPEEEKERLEGEYFADPDLLDEVEATRDELVDAYLRGELPRGRSESFEKYFMASPRRRERVEFSRALKQFSERRPAPTGTAETRTSAPRWRSLFAAIFAHRQFAFTAASLLLVVVGSWVAFRFFSAREQGGGVGSGQVASVPREQSPTPTAQPVPPDGAPAGTVTTQPAATPSPAPPSERDQRPSHRREPQVATFVLTPSLVRDGEETERLVIPRGTEVVQLRFGFEGNASRGYRATLRTPEGREVFSTGRVSVRETREGRTATLRVPAEFLKNEDYVLRLSAPTAEGDAVVIARHYFRVEKK